MVQPAGQVGQAVTQVAFGAGADHDGGAAGSDGGNFSGIRVGCMDQLPAPVQRQLITQPGNRALPGGLLAVLNFLGLFGNVDVDRQRCITHLLQQGAN